MPEVPPMYYGGMQQVQKKQWMGRPCIYVHGGPHMITHTVLRWII